MYPMGVAYSTFQKCKFLGMCRKDTKFGGEGRYTIYDIATTSGGSSNFNRAQMNKGPSQQFKFFVQHKKEFQLMSLDNALIRRNQAEGKDKIVEIIKHEVELKKKALDRAMAAGVWGNAGGSRGVISGTPTTTATLATRADIIKFELGMYCQFATDNGTAASPAGILVGSPDQARVVGVNERTGVITFDVNIATVFGAASGGFIFRAGDYANRFDGVPGINPVTEPTTGDSFRGVDRWTNPRRGSGQRIIGGGARKENVVIDAAAEAELLGIETKVLWGNPLDLKGLLKEAQSARVIQVDSKFSKISYSGMSIATGSGDVTILSESDVPKGNFWMNDPANYVLRSAGEFPRILTSNGGFLDDPNEDAQESRIGGDLQLDADDYGQCIIGTW
jgi:hypothetical protein